MSFHIVFPPQIKLGIRPNWHHSSAQMFTLSIMWRSSFMPACRKLTIVILQDLIIDGRSHADGLARKVGVVVESLPHRHTSRGITVTSQQWENIVLSAMPAVYTRTKWLHNSHITNCIILKKTRHNSRCQKKWKLQYGPNVWAYDHELHDHE